MRMEPTPSPWHRRIFALLAVLLAATAARGLVRSLSERGNDLTIYLDAAAAALAGENPLAVPGSIYLPFFDCLLAPLAWLPRPLFAAVWQTASFVCGIGGLLGAVRLVDPGRRSPWLGWLTLLVTLRLWDSNFSYGQANAFTFAMLVAALHALAAGRERAAGLWIGLGAAFKVLPGLALLLLAARARWRGVAIGLASLIGLSLVVPLLFLGGAGSVEAHRTWYAEVSGPYLQGGHALLEARPYVAGQSLLAATYKLLAATPVTSADLSRRAALAELDPDLVHWIARALIATHLGVLLGLLWRRRRDRGARAIAESGALTMTTALLCGPLVHKAHLCWSALGFAVLVSAVRDARTPAERLARGVPLALAAALIGLSTPLLFGNELVRTLVTHNALTLGTELLWIGQVLLASRSAPDGDAAPGWAGSER
jgi:hypothetical protein